MFHEKSFLVSGSLYLQDMNSLNCPSCLSDESVRTILWGMPSEEPDPSEFAVGGCCIEENMPEMKCIKCGWQGSLLEAEKAARNRRFIWTDEDALEIKRE